MQNKRKIEGEFGTKKRGGFSGNTYNKIIIMYAMIHYLQSQTLELNFRVAFGFKPSNPTYIYITKAIPTRKVSRLFSLAIFRKKSRL